MKLKKKHASRLAKVAIALLDNTIRGNKIRTPEGKPLVFDMVTFAFNDETFVSTSVCKAHTCGTSCCLAGYAIFAIPATRKFQKWSEVASYLTNARLEDWDHGSTNHFLFDVGWPSVPREAVRRVLTVLQSGVPEDYVTMNTYFPRLSNKAVRKQLETYL